MGWRGDGSPIKSPTLGSRGTDPLSAFAHVYGFPMYPALTIHAAVFRLLLRRRDTTNQPSRNIANRLIATVTFLTVTNPTPPVQIRDLARRRAGARPAAFFHRARIRSAAADGAAAIRDCRAPSFSTVTEQLMAVDTAPAAFFVQA